MLCPLRKRINSASFEECYENECTWWVGSPKDRFGDCSITFLGWLTASMVEENFFKSLTNEEKLEELKKISEFKKNKQN